MLALRVIILLFAVFGKNYVNSQEDSVCRTPLGDQGLCINIKRCDGLVRLLRTQSNNPEVRNYLLRSTCGYDGTIPLVCCPNFESQFRTSTQSPSRATLPPIPPQTAPVFPTSQRTTVMPTSSNRIQSSDLLQAPYCGVSNISNTRVVGGTDALFGEFPWIVALGYRNTKNPSVPRWLCGGSLITDRHVLTAAHCIYNKNVYLARVGDLDLYSDNDRATPVNIPIINAKIHENYSPTIFVNDIAVLTLERKHNIPYVTPVCLPTASQSYVDSIAIVAGWGAIYFNGPSSPQLQKVTIPIVDNEKCKTAFAAAKAVIDDRIICAGHLKGGKDACLGDSGGPLMLGSVQSDKKFFHQVGVVSYGFRCAEAGYPGVYTKVTEFIDWIKQNIQ